MKYEIAYLVSDLDDAKDNYPQKVHINIHLDITEIEWNFFEDQIVYWFYSHQ